MGKIGKTKYENTFFVGQIFGKWEILNNTILIEKEAKVYCKCTECNITEKYVPAFQLVKGVSKRCSVCGYSNKGEKNPSWKGIGEIPKSKITRIISGAKKRNIPYDLESEFLYELYKKQNGLCYYTKLPILFTNKTASLERINSSLGYVKENVVWVHKNVNIMKRDITFYEFLGICRLISKNFEYLDINLDIN